MPGINNHNAIAQWAVSDMPAMPTQQQKHKAKAEAAKPKQEKPGSAGNPYGLCLLGGGGVGKSSLSLALITSGKFFSTEYDPTIEDSYRWRTKMGSAGSSSNSNDQHHMNNKSIKDDDAEEIVEFDVLDTAGQEEFESMRAPWIRQSQGFLLVYAINSRNSFESMLGIYEEILRTLNRDAGQVPVVLVCNKCDLEESDATAGSWVPLQEGRDLAARWGAPFYETSAKSRLNTETCFQKLAALTKAAVDKQGGQLKPQRQTASAGEAHGCCIIS